MLSIRKMTCGAYSARAAMQMGKNICNMIHSSSMNDVDKMKLSLCVIPTDLGPSCIDIDDGGDDMTRCGINGLLSVLLCIAIAKQKHRLILKTSASKKKMFTHCIMNALLS
eukprot:960112_1